MDCTTAWPKNTTKRVLARGCGPSLSWEMPPEREVAVLDVQRGCYVSVTVEDIESHVLLFARFGMPVTIKLVKRRTVVANRTWALLRNGDVRAGAGAADFKEPGAAVSDDSVLGRVQPLRLLEEPPLAAVAARNKCPVRAGINASGRRARVDVDVGAWGVPRVRPHA